MVDCHLFVLKLMEYLQIRLINDYTLLISQSIVSLT